MLHAVITWLEAHPALAGWAQFGGAMLALLVTYLTVFIPVWDRRRRLVDEANRLLMNGYEVIESTHRSWSHFEPLKLSLQQASLSMTEVIDAIGQFPIFELRGNHGSMSPARRLSSMRGILKSLRLIIDAAEDDLGNRTATPDETATLLTLFEQPLVIARNLVSGTPMERPVWPTGDGQN